MIRNKLLIFCVVCSLSTLFAVNYTSAGLFSSPDNLQEAGEELAQNLSVAGVLANKRIAVLEFKTQGAVQDSMLGKRIAEYVSSGLVGIKDHNWDVVDRFEIARLRNEMEEHKDSVFDFNVWMRKKLQADLLVLGNYVIAGDDISITTKIVNPESGSTVSSASITLSANSEIKQLSKTRKPRTKFAGAVEDITAILTGNGRGIGNQGKSSSALKLYKIAGGNRIPFKRSNVPVFNVGDKMGFSVMPPINSKLYIFNYEPGAEKGEAILLYPIPGLRLESFPAKRTRRFPSYVSRGVTSYDVDPPLGRMVFKIIGVDDTINLDLTNSLKVEDGYYLLDSSNLNSFMDDLSSLPDISWWSEDVEFWIQ
ncbi:FlgO family outer membrane protein [Maridesulfovibrio frigidus]|uniref:FlgO family outer membrane protein n=1 Tax=Maridesulfovibrio frigidus TaxID=340956 RepID=UPI0004E20EC7|nr:FlgO family outer membrane protein [Maridesulfovibrio frigidus]